MYFDPNENLVNWDIALQACLSWLKICGSLVLVVLFISLVNLLLTNGLSGVQRFVGELAAILGDIFSISIRRVLAITRLTFLEAYRRKALMVFVVFGLLFMFAGWFMGKNEEMTPDQVKVYISFVLTSITWLTLPVVLLLGCFGIPEDIRIRSIHTVVTKPVRRIEIVIGRMIGISLIGALVLLVMAGIGNIWIVRQTPPKSQALLTCRVPQYGGIRFIDRNGLNAQSGINVGDIWAFRSFIEGATKARAQWQFHNVNESVLDAKGNLKLENSFTAFRSHKGDMTRQLFYDIRIYNPKTNLSYTTDPQPLDEFRSKQDLISRKITIDDTQYDLIKDFVTENGDLHIEVSCIDREQYVGVARSDLFIRLPDQPFWAGYWKAVFGIFMMIALLAMIGVATSTFVKGPIAAVVTFVVFIVSGKRSQDFIDNLLSGTVQGGGFLESVYRLVTHLGPTVELPGSPAFSIMKYFDKALMSFLWLCRQVIPRLKSFNMTEFVANGFDVPFDVSLLPSIMVTTAFIIPCIMVGYFALRVRELESK